MLGLALNRSIVRQRSRHAAAIASSIHPSHFIHFHLNVRPYSAKHAPSDREPTAFASEAYHEREVPGKPFRVDRYLRDPSPATTETPIDLTPEQRKIIERTLRVDLVGEGGANWIYQATKFVADLKGDKETSKKVEVSRPCVLPSRLPLTCLSRQEMWSTERHHLRTLSTLQKQHRVRPTLLYPLWKAASLTVGAATAMMGPRAIMACTEAVETVIGEHYDE